MRFEGRVVLVTGGGSGIGRAIATRFASEGARVAVNDVRAEAAEAVAKALGGEARAVVADVADSARVRAMVEEVARVFGGLDVLVNNAGLALGRDPFAESTEEDERKVLETNVNGLIRMTRLCLPHLEDGGGHIVNLGSIAAIWPYEKGTLYCLSKAAVHAFSRGLREDLLGKPIRVTTIAPGLVETDFSRVRFGGDEDKARAVYANVALGGPIRADDVADCIMFALTRPANVNVDEIVVMALAQATGTRIIRE